MSDPTLQLRIGIHLGDVVFREGDVFGDGVNIASRIVALAEPGGICVSAEVYQSVRNQPGVDATSLGQHDLKHVNRPIEVFALGHPQGVASGSPRGRVLRRRRIGAVSAFGVLGLLVVLMVGYLLRRSTPTAPGPTAIRSLAVLPLENLSGDPEQAYFADGMTDELITDLAKIGALRVISRTSTMHYKGSPKPLPEIARELNVDGVVEGTVLRAANCLCPRTSPVLPTPGAHLLGARRFFV